jgi:hypothetical protein
MSGSSPNLAAIGDLPLVQRLHQALAVGLAIFMLTLVVLREPFHGYLAEVQISGPSTAGLNLDEAVQWLKKVEPHLAAVATPAGEISAKCELRATYVGPHPRQALSHLDELADRWLYQYLPDRLQAYRHGTLASLRTAVNEARQREDALQEQLESLRQRQVADKRDHGSGVRSQETADREQGTADRGQGTVAVVGAAAGGNDAASKLRERLDSLRVQLSHLQGSHTEEHPEIVTLKSQISSLERQLGQPANASSSDPESIQEVRGRQTRLAAPQTVIQASGQLAVQNSPTDADSQLEPEISAVARALTSASRQRQAAEQHLTERMQELSSGPTAAQWSAGPAHVVTRLGGTPRSLTLALAGLLACVGAIAMFRLTAVELVRSRIESSAELASGVGLPVIGDLSKCLNPAAGKQAGRRFLTPARLRIVTTAAEGFVAVAAAACLVSVAIDPSLAREVLADPFGTLSEVIGRFGA